MSYTRAQLRAWVLENADASASSGFDTSPGGIVDRKIGRAHDRLWADILNAARFYRGAIRTPQTDAQGLVALSALSDLAAPDDAERLYRIIDVTVDGYPMEEVTDNLAPYARCWQLGGTASGSGIVASARTFWIFSGVLYSLPVLPNASTIIVVNHRPTRVDQLSSDTAVVEFPDGYEDILAVHGAAEMLMKGARETEASMELRASVQPDLDKMLNDLARATTNPSRVRYSDRPEAWAG